MTIVLEVALAEVAKLPPEEQDVLAALLLDEMRSEQRWSKAFAESQSALTALAAEALAERRVGKAKSLKGLWPWTSSRSGTRPTTRQR
ncbi:MAG: hypothetical protein U1F25_12975 [Rubrivivax sp.]